MAAWLVHGEAEARGPSPYLPLNLSPEIERQIDQVMLLAGRPTVRRPIATAAVLDALPQACELDPVLCQRVRSYLRAYQARLGVTHVGTEFAVTSGDSDRTLPNRRGMSVDDEWAASAAAQLQVNDYLLLQVGGIAFPDEAMASGSWLSTGTQYFQLDVGFREHHWSPMSDSAMTIGTQARIMPSVTLSNYTPFSKLGITYEAFVARMSRMDDIAFEGRTTSGNPRIAGLNLAIEPVPGWSLGASRLLQFAGGERKRSSRDLLNAFFLPTRYDNISDDLSSDNQFGNQVAALTSKFVFPTSRPVAVYFEYAGEDGSRKEGWRLGNTSLSAGIEISRVWNRFDFTYEVSDWQNGWFVNGVYPDGMSNEGHPIGHWGANERVPRDAVGAQSHSLRAGWAAPFGGLFELRYRTLQNEEYFGHDYEREHDVSLRYSRFWNQFAYGAEINVGRDVFGEEFQRASAFVRYVPGQWGNDFATPSEPLPESATRNVDLFVDAGVSATRLEFNPYDGVTKTIKTNTVGPHLGVGLRRAVSSRNDFGVRLEMDEMDGRAALGVRAIDYRRRVSPRFALGLFAGAMRYDTPAATYGYYGGLNLQVRDILPRIDLNLDVRASDKMARDTVLPGDSPNNTWGDVLYQIYSGSLYLSYRFK